MNIPHAINGFIIVAGSQQSSQINPKKFNEKKGPDGLWQSRACVPSALLLNALNFALNFSLFDPAFLPAAEQAGL